MSFSKEFQQCIQSIGKCVYDPLFLEKFQHQQEPASALSKQSFGIIVLNKLGLASPSPVSNADLFLGVYNNGDTTMVLEVLLGDKVHARVVCKPRSFTSAFQKRTFVPLVTLAYHRITFGLSEPRQTSDCSLVFGYLSNELRLELMQQWQKTFGKEGDLRRPVTQMKSAKLSWCMIKSILIIGTILGVAGFILAFGSFCVEHGTHLRWMMSYLGVGLLLFTIVIMKIMVVYLERRLLSEGGVAARRR